MIKYRATQIIDEAFNDKKIFHSIEQQGKIESLCAGFTVPKGPQVMIRFISCDDNNDVAVRIPNLFNNVPQKDWDKTLKVLNKVNAEMRYVKFFLDEEEDIVVGVDIPINCSDECLGEVAFEFFCRTMSIVCDKYANIARILYAEEVQEDSLDKASQEETLLEWDSDALLHLEDDDPEEEADLMKEVICEGKDEPDDPTVHILRMLKDLE